MALAFKKAVKYEAKGRVALIGPAGSGKSWNMLTLARQLVGPEGKIAAIDTEHGSLSKYADIFNFDVLELGSFSPDNFMAALKAAETGGYQAFLCDSLSHFWIGKDGALEFVDMASKKHRDGMGGWKEFRPIERAMVDAMIASPCHVIVTMRTKTEYQEQTDSSTGKKKRVKIGLAPVQREGLEFEFDLIGYMDEENTLIVDKTRCSYYAQKVIPLPKAKDFQPFVDWLKGAVAPITISREQAEALFLSARAKGIGSEALLKQLGVARLGDLRLDQLQSANKWIEMQQVPTPPAPVVDPTKAYDSEIELYIKLGILMNDLGDYVETLPFASDMAAVTAHLKNLRETKKPAELITAIRALPGVKV